MDARDLEKEQGVQGVQGQHGEHGEQGLDVPETLRLDAESSGPTPSGAASSHGDGLELEEKLSNQLSRIRTEDYPSPVALLAIAAALSLAVFLFALDLTIVATAIPHITDEFHSLQDVGWYGSAFFLTVASFQNTWGKAYKYFPIKATFLVSILVFELGSLICAVSQNSITLIVGRAVAGAGAAGLSSGSYTIVGFAVRPEKRPIFTGIMGATFGIASTVGPLLGGVFTDRLTWRWCFWINLPLGGVAAGIILFIFTAPAAARPEKVSWREKFLQMDIPGTFTIMGAVVCFLLALQWGGVTKPWSDSSVIGTLVGFSLLVIIFVLIEWYQGDRALVPFRLLNNRTIAANCSYILFLAGAFFTLLYILPIYFQSVKNASAGNSGIRNLPLVIGGSLFTILCGILITTTGQFVPFMILGSAVATIGCGLLYTLSVGSGPGHWIGYQAVAGIGLGFCIQVPVIANQGLVKLSDLSTISAVTLFFQTIGGAFFVAAGQTAFENKLAQSIVHTAPGVSPHLLVVTGATQLRTVFSAEQLPGILVAYVDGVRVTFALCIALAGISFLVAFFPRFENIKGKLPGASGPA